MGICFHFGGEYLEVQLMGYRGKFQTLSKVGESVYTPVKVPFVHILSKLGVVSLINFNHCGGGGIVVPHCGSLLYLK